MKPPALELSRLVKAPRAMVFHAWSEAGLLKHWFCPRECSVTAAELDFRPGGAFNICMRLPDGTEHWMHSHFTEISAPERLGFAGKVSADGAALFSVETSLRFTEEEGGTRLELRQIYEIHDPAWAKAAKGAEAGWRSTLDRLEDLTARLASPAVQDSFTLERRLPAPPDRVFHVLTDPEAKAGWFSGGEGYTALARHMEARPGGREHVHGRWPDGTESVFDAVYFEVLPNRRLIYAYEMHLNGIRISVSLATLELAPNGTGTRLTMTEQGSFLNGYEDKGGRERGTNFLLDKLARALAGGASA